MTTIGIIDYEVGNIRSIHNAFTSQGAHVVISSDREVLLATDGLVLPGVGSFKHGMEKLKEKELIDIIDEYVKSGKPLLGICLGMQLLFSKSFEFGETAGLGIIDGVVDKLQINVNVESKLPHVNWNSIDRNLIRWDATIFDDVESGSDAYFVHSYVASPASNDNVLSTTFYSDVKFCSAVKKNNIYGCQFHPEKSGVVGLKIIKNFIDISRGE